MTDSAAHADRSDLGILVGIDGSDNALVAAAWSAREAAARRTPVTLCRVVQASPGDSQYDRTVQAARRDLDRARARVVQAAEVQTRDLVVNGPASRELVERSADAGLVVVGARGRGGFAGLLLGSVSDQVATHARCPVAVVRQEPEPTADQPVLVGVDNTAGARPALAYAFWMACRDGHPLVALHSYSQPAVIPELGYLPIAPYAHVADRAHTLVDDQLLPWRRRYPTVTVTTELTTQPAAMALCEASHNAHLLVVGATGRGLLTAVLGSVTRKVLHHAACPVVVAR